jgi:hypothetical protein
MVGSDLANTPVSVAVKREFEAQRYGLSTVTTVIEFS